MTQRKIQTVSVRQLPASIDSHRRQLFFSEFESCLENDRPCIVLDCSKVRQMNKQAIDVLLSCLEEAMKRNGDVKLAAVSAEARTVLRHTAVDSLFETFDAIEDAVEDYLHPGLTANAGSNPLGPPNDKPGSDARPAKTSEIMDRIRSL